MLGTLVRIWNFLLRVDHDIDDHQIVGSIAQGNRIHRKDSITVHSLRMIVPRDIDIYLLRAFIAMVDRGSVTGAARLLNRTQAAVSQQIKRLEEVFGTELFSREHKRITLALYGERLFAQAQKIVALNDETWGMMTTPSFHGDFRLGVSMYIVAHYTPPILRRFNNAWPHILVSLQAGNSHELLEELDSGDIDLTTSTDHKPKRKCETLRRDKLIWIGVDGSFAHQQRPLPILLGRRSYRFRPAVVSALSDACIDWRVVLEVTDQEAVNATVAAGLAVTAMLRDNVPKHLLIISQDCGLPSFPEFDINLYLPRSRTSEHGLELAHHIRAEFAAQFGPTQILDNHQSTRIKAAWT